MSSGGLEWRGRVDDGVLVVGYMDDGDTWRATVVDTMSDDAIASMHPDDDGVGVRIDEPLGIWSYRLCREP